MKKIKIELHTQILIGLILGIVLGLVLKEHIVWVKPFGTAFIRLITMIVVPLVFASLLVGTASLGDIKKLGRIGGKTIIYFTITTVVAIFLGLFLANVLKPGSNISPEAQKQLMETFKKQAEVSVQKMKEKPSISEILLNVIPKNPFESLSNSEMLQIIFFAIFLGIILTMLPREKSKPVLDFFDGINDAMIKMVLVIMKLAPYGVFALIAGLIGEFGKGILMSLFLFTLIVSGGCILHMITVFPLSLKLLTKFSVLKFFRGIRPAQYIAFSSTSSSATLPINMECCETNLGVPKEICSFVLPLGATIDMNGTSLYQGVAAVFIAQVLGIHLSISQQITIVVTATLGAIGTAGVPAAGVIMLAIVLKAINIPLEMIALVLGVDRIVDMFRTTLNITGDAACAVVVASTEGILKEQKENKLESKK